jgi:hypothetical protein
MMLVISWACHYCGWCLLMLLRLSPEGGGGCPWGCPLWRALSQHLPTPCTSDRAAFRKKKEIPRSLPFHNRPPSSTAGSSGLARSAIDNDDDDDREPLAFCPRWPSGPDLWRSASDTHHHPIRHHQAHHPRPTAAKKELQASSATHHHHEHREPSPVCPSQHLTWPPAGPNAPNRATPQTATALWTANKAGRPG